MSTTSSDPSRLSAEAVEGLLAGVAAADQVRYRAWPGPRLGRQPVQVLYVPADRVNAASVSDIAGVARELFDRHAATPEVLAKATGMVESASAEAVWQQVGAKLAREPIEDLRVDFEDGYLGFFDEDEDADAVRTGTAVGTMTVDGTAPPFLGLRVKPFCDGTARRSVRTLDRFLGALLAVTDGALPDGFVVTFPKIMSSAHVAAFADVLTALEDVHGLADGTLGFEAQIETTQSILDEQGRVALRSIRDAGAGRLRAVHFGVFDYTAAVGLPADGQRLTHPACDFARHVMQVTFAGTEVRLSDGSVNARPADDTTEAVHRVWRRHADAVRHSLAHGFTQGWDLDPSHLISRYAVVYADLLTGIEDVMDRLARWHAREGGGVSGGGGGTGDGEVMDEPATITVLQRVLQRAIDCGAVEVHTAEDRGALLPP
ncbi:aldolase/citrate lyase family protein [soil metagenome]